MLNLFKYPKYKIIEYKYKHGETAYLPAVKKTWIDDWVGIAAIEDKDILLSTCHFEYMAKNLRQSSIEEDNELLLKYSEAYNIKYNKDEATKLLEVNHNKVDILTLKEQQVEMEAKQTLQQISQLRHTWEQNMGAIRDIVYTHSAKDSQKILKSYLEEIANV